VDSTITLEDDEPEVVEGLIQYLYEQALDLKASQKNSLLMLTVKLYVIGDKYDVNGLSELASQKFGETASSAWQDTSFIPALKIIYEETFDRTLKNIAIKVVTAHVDKFLAKKEFTELCELNGGLSLDILRATRPGPMPKPQPSFLGLIPVQIR